MSPMKSRHARGAVALATLALALSALPAVAQSEAASGVAVEVTGLTAGEIVTANRIDLTVQPIGFELSAAAGTPPIEGEGHYHVILDGGLIDMYATPEASVSLQNVTSGPHTLMVVPAGNDHMEVMEGAAAIDFDYQPAEPLPEITAVTDAGVPTVTIVSPTRGEVVSGTLDLVISTTDFTLSADLLGKPNVAGYGHWHVFIDAAEGMATMAGMSGADTFTVDTSALSPGPHPFIAVLTDNLHAPLDPMVMAAVELEVSDAAEASAESVVVSLQEWTLELAELTFPAGAYTFEASNDGTIAHGLSLSGDGISARTPDISFAAGQSESFSLDLAPGTYELFCPVPGHKEAGMVATLTVSG